VSQKVKLSHSCWKPYCYATAGNAGEPKSIVFANFAARPVSYLKTIALADRIRLIA